MPTALPRTLFRTEAPLRLCAALALCMILASSPGCNRTKTLTPEEKAYKEKMEAFARANSKTTKFMAGIEGHTEIRYIHPARMDFILSDETKVFWNMFDEPTRRTAMQGLREGFQSERVNAGLPPSLSDTPPEVHVFDDTRKEIARIDEKGTTFTP